MAILLPKWERYRDRKPHQRFELDESHWVAPYLYAASILNGDAQDLVGASDLGSQGVVFSRDGAQFDGNTARMSTESYDFTDTITIIGRIRPTNVSNTNRILYGKYSDLASGPEDSFMLRQDTDDVQMFIRNSAGTAWTSASAANQLVAGSSTDVAGSFDGSTVLAVADSTKATASYSGAIRSNPGVTTYFGVSNSLAANAGFNGLMEYMYILHAGLAYEEIKIIHEAPYQILKPRRSYWVMPEVVGAGGSLFVRAAGEGGLAGYGGLAGRGGLAG